MSEDLSKLVGETVMGDMENITHALKLQELVKEQIKDQEDNCDSDMELLCSLVEESEK